MDPRNERLVHKRMVDIACGKSSSANGASGHNVEVEDDENGHPDGADEDTGGNEGGSQYFLITPKLLNGLEYARGMKVLCIASGEKMPTEKSKIDFGKCIDIARGLRGMGRLGSGGRVNGITAAG